MQRLIAGTTLRPCDGGSGDASYGRAPEMQLSVQDKGQAKKLAKQAVSAVKYDDNASAVQALLKALGHLQDDVRTAKQQCK